MGPGESGEKTGIYVISIFGGVPRKLREDAGRAAVAPDAKLIAFIAGKGESELWLMSANGENARKITDAGEGGRFLQLQWSPDGRRLALLKFRSGAETSNVSIEAQELIGGSTNTIFSDQKLRSFCWTPDNRIIYSLEEPPPRSNDTNLWEIPLAPHSARATGPPGVSPVGRDFPFGT